MEPAVGVVGRQHTSLCVIPPFLKQGEWVVCGWVDVLETVRTDWKSRCFCSCVLSYFSKRWYIGSREGMGCFDLGR